MDSQEHAHKDDNSHKDQPSTSSHSESCPVGSLVSTKSVFILLIVLCLAFGITMMRKYSKLEAKIVAMGLEINNDGTVQVAQNADPKAEEHARALSQLGHRLGALKLSMDEIETLLKELGVKVESKKASGPHGTH
ncbi:MAG: hypothetical protein J3T61_06775 [Candidatus Brocadiales bacterium]|nr:hypothetical protein [Candidatus Bathyanammoxibius sp.]